ncbi:hypothetical protein [Mycobacterium sp. 1423905.2]|uniref:hypothetical protein n=1 Tax=Mycobacterium sp. 1423905.2 TaxID=1856859 RepID=UPI0012EA1741|nr:hypothetical protein [Mycobacterium sp. 1423905.2]
MSGPASPHSSDGSSAAQPVRAPRKMALFPALWWVLAVAMTIAVTVATVWLV